jgi:hypothetical protein
MKISNIILVIFVSSILCSCEKNNPTDPDKPADPDNSTKADSSYSSQKQIQSVVFRSADNPSLGYDISGMVSSDTVKFLFAPNTATNKLVPDISFIGKTISPLNKTVRDFTNPVAYTITAEDGSTKQYVFSCAVADSATMLLGKWSVVKDSSTNDGFVTSDGVYVYPGVYIGKAEDYWEFTANGTFNMRANGQTGTGFKYHIVPNAKLFVDIISPAFDDGNILLLTLNKATFFWKKTNTNGKTYSRMVYLKK